MTEVKKRVLRSLRSHQDDTPLYARHARAADRAAWSVERDVRWTEIDRAQALAQPDILAKLRSAALIESFHPVNLSRLIRFAWDDIDAGVVFSLEMYEGFKHFHVLRMYLTPSGTSRGSPTMSCDRSDSAPIAATSIHQTL